jgi:hypothetical protein
MKCRLSPCQLLAVPIAAKETRTLSPVGNVVVHGSLDRTGGLNTDVPFPSRQEVRNGDKNVACGTPEVLDDVVLSPLVSNSNLVDRVDVLDQL